MNTRNKKGNKVVTNAKGKEERPCGGLTYLFEIFGGDEGI
jgi:hypothetical protein